MNIELKEEKIAFFAVTQNGKALALKLRENLGTGDVFITSKLALLHENKSYIKEIQGKLSAFVGEKFNLYDTFIFIMATGIVVRTIAPYILDKLVDPAVLVMDEKGENVISLLSGHMGGANQMTLEISQLLGAHPVITTSTDVNHKAALDNVAKELNGYIEDFKEKVKEVNYLLVHDKKVGLYNELDYKVDTRGFEIIEEERFFKDKEVLEVFEKIVAISVKKHLGVESHKVIQLIPRTLVLGVGCRKETSIEHMEEALESFLETHNIHPKALKMIASVDVKKDEKAIISLASKLQVPFHIVSKDKIKEVEDLFDKSEFVKKNIGVGNVAEPCAYLLSGGTLWIKKCKYNGITFAIGRSRI